MSVMPKDGSPNPSVVRKALASLNSQNIVIYGLIAAVAAIVARLPVAAAYTLPRDMYGSWINRVFIAVILVPIAETVLGQWLPVLIAQKLSFGRGVQIVVAALAFSLCHLPSVAAVVTAILPGAVFAYVFTSRSKRGYQQGLAAVYIAHLWEIVLVLVIRGLLG